MPRNSHQSMRATKLSRTDRAIVRVRHGNGSSQRTLARFFGCCTETIRNTVRNKMHDKPGEDILYATGRLLEDSIAPIEVKEDCEAENTLSMTSPIEHRLPVDRKMAAVTTQRNDPAGHPGGIPSKLVSRPDRTTTRSASRKPSQSTQASSSTLLSQPQATGDMGATRASAPTPSVLSDVFSDRVRDTGEASGSNSTSNTGSRSSSSATVHARASVLAKLQKGREARMLARYTEVSVSPDAHLRTVQSHRPGDFSPTAKGYLLDRGFTAKSDSHSPKSQLSPAAGTDLALATRGLLRNQDTEPIWSLIQVIGLGDQHFAIMLAEGVRTTQDIESLRSMDEATLDLVGSSLMSKGFSMFEYLKLKAAIRSNKL